MKLLYVNACVRGSESRTARLAGTFLRAFQNLRPDVSLVVQELPDMGLRPVDAAALSRREALCDRFAWHDAYLKTAADFQAADMVVIAAPYWDLSFPSMLKVWVEHIYVRNLTFRYENDRCIGLCRAREAVYITTAGSPIGEHDWGTGYMKAVLNMLGIPGFTSIRAEALDLEGRDTEGVMREAERQAIEAANALAARLTNGGT